MTNGHLFKPGALQPFQIRYALQTRQFDAGLGGLCYRRAVASLQCAEIKSTDPAPVVKQLGPLVVGKQQGDTGRFTPHFRCT